MTTRSTSVGAGGAKQAGAPQPRLTSVTALRYRWRQSGDRVGNRGRMEIGNAPVRDPREAWYSPYRGMPFALSLKYLLGGAVLYALLLLVAMAGSGKFATYPVVGPSIYLTPMFGLPLVLGTANRPGRTRRILYFLILLPLVHMAANYLAVLYGMEYFDLLEPGADRERNLIAGGIGGFTGALLSVLLLHLVRLTARDRRHWLAMIASVVLLTAAGAGTMAAGLQWTDALRRTGDPGRAILWYETVHFGWQCVFAVCLAWLMRKRPEPRRPRPVLQ